MRNFNIATTANYKSRRKVIQKKLPNRNNYRCLNVIAYVEEFLTLADRCDHKISWKRTVIFRRKQTKNNPKSNQQLKINRNGNNNFRLGKVAQPRNNHTGKPKWRIIYNFNVRIGFYSVVCYLSNSVETLFDPLHERETVVTFWMEANFVALWVMNSMLTSLQPAYNAQL